jgi:cytochrome P450
VAVGAARQLPLVGDLFFFVDDRLAFFEACRARGDLVRCRLGPKRLIVLSHPDLVRELYVHEAKHFERGLSGAAFRAVLGDGLLLSEGERWQRQRREVQPLFAEAHGAGWVAETLAATDGLVARWRDGERRDIHAEMRRLTLDVAARVLLGAASDERGRLHPALETVLVRDVFRAPTELPVLREILGARRGSPLRRLDALVARSIERDSSDVIRGLRARGVDDRELRDQLVTLLFTAQDTTSVALTWAWHLLSRDERVRRIVGEGPSPDYLRALTWETMRLFPPIVAEFRECVRPCEVGGRPIASGTFVIFSQWVLHRDPRWFDRPLSFEPERWLDGLQERLHPFAYFPFGGGRRNCVGKPLAQAILATAIPRIARGWRLEPASAAAPRVEAFITPKPKGGLPMTLRRLS